MSAIGLHKGRRAGRGGARRSSLLSAAAQLFDTAGPEATGVKAVARRAGVTRSTAYRYFDGREAVLEELLLAELAGFADDMEAGLAATPPGYLATVAHVSAGCLLAHPRLGRLLSIFPEALGQGHPDRVQDEPGRAIAALNRRVAAALARVLPALTIDDCAWAAAMIATIIAGMWPGCEPSPAAARLLARPEFSAIRVDVTRDLERVILVLLNGLIARRPGGGRED